jgi:hypothetical protein
VNGLLRFTGLLNAAIWLGAVVFSTLGVLPAVHSQRMMDLLGSRYFTYLSGAIAQDLWGRLCYWQIGCAVIAWLHLLAEWLYLGRTPRRWWVTLQAVLLAASLVAGFWLCPKLTILQRTQRQTNPRVAEREAAERSFRLWDGAFQAVNVLLIGGVAVYFWRLTRAEESPRFVSPMKFRG